MKGSMCEKWLLYVLVILQLIKEIKDELYVHGGRINTVDLAKELNVDLSQINTSVAEIIKGKEVQLVSGYLITHYYLEKIAREINEKLQLQGQITVGELTLQYDLPAELLQHNVLEKYLGKIIIGKQDPSDARTFYTEEYITRTKAKIRGALMGLLKPTPAAVIMNHCNVAERLFMCLFDQVNAPGVLTGRQAGASYVPTCYTKAQNDWVISFFRQNNYLEYDALTRLGLSDPKGYVKRVLPNEDLTFLSSCVIGSLITEQVETALEECIASKSYLDVVSLLPSILSDADIENVLDSLLKKSNNHYIDNLRQVCMATTQKKAEAIVKSGKYQQFYLEKQLAKGGDSQPGFIDHKAERREERRRKAASGKAGGGSQGRETKTKAVKKHQRSKQAAHDSDSDDATGVVKKTQNILEIITVEDIEAIIKDTLENEGLDDLVPRIADYLQGGLNQTALAIAKEAADKILQDAGQNRKQTHSSAQDKVNILVNDIKLYEKGLKSLPSEQQAQFIKYLLKSLGGDILSELCKYAANQCNLSVQGDLLSVEQRNKILHDLTEEFKKPLVALNATLSDQNLESFYQTVDDLHLAVLAIFTTLTQNMLHASGRQVPIVISFLKTQLKEEDYVKLQYCH
ncbi:E3 UFM1-protein ligase 1, partial [Operophtera brumata]